MALLPSDLVEDKEGNAHPPAWVEYTKVPSLKSALIFCMGHTGALFPGGPHEVNFLLLSVHLGSTQPPSQQIPGSFRLDCR